MSAKDYSSPRAEYWVTIGGRSKKGEKYPDKFEGFYLGRTEGPDNFNEGKIKVTYLFKTDKGIAGVNSNANLKRKMDENLKNFAIAEGKPALGALVTIKYVGDLDTGKGNPMKTYSVTLDSANMVEVDAYLETTELADESEDDAEEAYAAEADEEDAAQSAALAAAERTAANKAKVEAMLKNAKNRTK